MPASWDSIENPSFAMANSEDQQLSRRPIEEAPKNKKEEALPTLVKLSNLAKLSTFGSVANWLCAIANPVIQNQAYKNPSHEKNWIGVFQDLFLRLRLMAQYTLHAQPGTENRPPDDIQSANVHNLTAQRIGQAVFKYHAFWSIPSWFMQNFVTTGKHAASRIINYPLKALDRGMSRITNMFWNLRRVTMALMPYFNKNLEKTASPEDRQIMQAKIKERCEPVRDFMSLATNYTLIKITKGIKKIFPEAISEKICARFRLDENKLSRKQREISAKANVEYNDEIDSYTDYCINGIKENFLGNLKAINSHQHKSIFTDEMQHLNQEEPNTPIGEITTKLVTQVLGLPAGGIGFVLNTASTVLGGVGELLRIKPLIGISQNCSDIAMGLMSIVYGLGEVGTHFSKMKQQLSTNKKVKAANVMQAALGTTAMGWKFTKGLAAAAKIPGLLIRPLSRFGDKILNSRLDNILDPLFLLFFSTDRVVNLAADRKSLHEHSAISYQAEQEAKAMDNLPTLLSIPLQILMRNPTYTDSKS